MRAAAAVLGLLPASVWALVCASCGFQSNQAPGDGAPPVDAAGDASVDAPPDGPLDGARPDAPRPDGPPSSDACVTFSRQLNTCGLPLTNDLTIAEAASYNTDTRELRIGGQLTPVTGMEVVINGSYARHSKLANRSTSSRSTAVSAS